VVLADAIFRVANLRRRFGDAHLGAGQRLLRAGHVTPHADPVDGTEPVTGLAPGQSPEQATDLATDRLLGVPPGVPVVTPDMDHDAAGADAVEPASSSPASTDRASTDRASTDRASTDRASTDIDLAATLSGAPLRFVVQDGVEARVTLVAEGDDVRLTCNCSRRRSCAHRAAAMLWLAERRGRGGARQTLPWQVSLHRGMAREGDAGVVAASGARLVFRLELTADGAPVLSPERDEISPRGSLRRVPFGLLRTWSSDPLDPPPDFMAETVLLLCRRLRQWPMEGESRARSGQMFRFLPPPGERYGLLLEMARGGVLYAGESPAALTEGQARTLSLQVSRLESGGVRLGTAGIPGQVVASDPPLYLDTGRIGPLLTPFSGQLIAALTRDPVEVPAADVAEFAMHWLPRLTARGDVGLPPELAPQVREGVKPVPRITLGDGGGALVVRLEFAYGEAPPVGPETIRDPLLVEDGHIVIFRRDTLAEGSMMQRLIHPRAPGMQPPTPGAPGQWSMSGDDAYDFLLLELPSLAAEGWEIFGEAALMNHRVYRGGARIHAQVRSGIDWFDLEVVADFDGQHTPASDLMAAWKTGRRYVRLPDGRVARLPDWVRRHADDLEEAGLGSAPQARLSRFQLPLLAALAEEAELTADDRYQEAATRLQGFTKVTEVAPPEGLCGTLRPYQAEGLAWLEFLRGYGFHGILADDMGLGKTLQVIALLLLEKQRGHATGPSLVVVPTSLIFNWAHELGRFAPSLGVLTWHGPDRQRLLPRMARADIILTNYALVRQDLALLEKQQFHYLVLDEAQYVKNPDSQVSRAVRALTARHRLALTGTPLENHLGELWAQFAFLMPGLLGTYGDFRSRFGGPVERGDTEAATTLVRRVRPFILRRTKEQVASELPERVETILYCRLEGEQNALYLRIRDQLREQVARSIRQRGLAGSHLTILDALLKLRQVCCHPELLPPSLAGDIQQSAKTDLFMELITEAIEEGHRVLVFSQFVSMLRILRRRLDAVQVPYSYLDGRTRDRERRVNEFQENASIPIFLISLKAGGTGLNLTGADYVVHFDPWWNPAVEAQATDRTHRIGQTRKVFSYKLIAEDTVEEKILALQDRKRNLSDLLLGERQDLAGHLSVTDLEQIFGHLEK